MCLLFWYPYECKYYHYVYFTARTCSEWYDRGLRLSGETIIDPDGESGYVLPFYVYCDMTINGGETIVSKSLVFSNKINVVVILSLMLKRQLLRSWSLIILLHVFLCFNHTYLVKQPTKKN